MTTSTASTTPFPSRAELLRAEQKARHFWVTLIVGLLSLQVAGGITAIVLAVGDPTVAIIPNYHQSAINWDTTRRALQLTQKLDWQIQPAAGPISAQADRRELSVRILSRDGEPIHQLYVHAKVFHHARGTAIHEVGLKEIEPGYYVGTTGMTQAGLWQVQLQIEGEQGIGADSQEMWVE